MVYVFTLLHSRRALVTGYARVRRVFGTRPFTGDDSLAAPIYPRAISRRRLTAAVVFAGEAESPGHRSSHRRPWPQASTTTPPRTSNHDVRVPSMEVGVHDRRWDPTRHGDGTALILAHGFPAFLIPARMILERRCYCSRRFHRGIVCATARRQVAPGSMMQSLLCRQHVDLLTLPNLQCRLLDGAGKRKRQRPRQS